MRGMVGGVALSCALALGARSAGAGLELALSAAAAPCDAAPAMLPRHDVLAAEFVK